MRRAVLFVCLGTLLVGGSTASALKMPSAPRCPVFPKSNPWNQRVDTLPVAANSDEIVRSIGAGGERARRLRLRALGGRADRDPDHGRRQEAEEDSRLLRVRRRVRPRPVPDPDAASRSRAAAPRPATGTRSSSTAPRAASTSSTPSYPKAGGWKAGSGAIWNLRSNKLRPAGWTSADAAGLPIFPGLARYDEVKRGVIDHALRFTVQRTRRAYVFPARHYASDSNDASLPPMGLRLRLKASFDVSGYPRQARIVLVALKRYGMIVADNGSSWYITGAPDSRWSNDQLHTLGRVKGSDFEVVQGR